MENQSNGVKWNIDLKSNLHDLFNLKNQCVDFCLELVRLCSCQRQAIWELSGTKRSIKLVESRLVNNFQQFSKHNIDAFGVTFLLSITRN